MVLQPVDANSELRCDVCLQGFAARQSVANARHTIYVHTISQHPETLPGIRLRQGEQYPCDDCRHDTYSATTPRRLWLHFIRRHSGSASARRELALLLSSVAENRRRYYQLRVCDICSVPVEGRKEAMATHLRLVHGAGGPVTKGKDCFRCDDCGLSLSNRHPLHQHQLSIHSVKHSKTTSRSRTTACDDCGGGGPRRIAPAHWRHWLRFHRTAGRPVRLPPRLVNPQRVWACDDCGVVKRFRLCLELHTRHHGFPM